MARLRVAAALTSILVAVLAAVLWKSGEQHQIFDVPSGLGFAKFSWTSFRQSKPDTTAVVLNWSRLPNVVRIASLLCEHSLDDAIASVVVWNNNPKALTYEDFAFTGCPTTKLKIHNSPENLYFQARFLACAQSTTEFCFIQDDDYIVWPSVIQSLHARIANSDVRGVHLLPPHEHLSSTLQTVVAPPNIHTDFAWLGHGAIIRRSVCTEFLSLLEHLKMDDEQRKMADNYYTILSNTFTEKWFDQGYELGGGQPFTVGTEGDLRNQRHIASATQMLDQLFAGETSPCARGVPYVDCSNDVQAPKLSHAPCKDTACLFQTNIQLLPAISAQASRAAELAKVAQDSDAALGAEVKEHYLGFAPSFAVDGDPRSAFQSLCDARAGDFVALGWHNISSSTEVIFVVDQTTEALLTQAHFTTKVGSTSVDKHNALERRIDPALRCRDYASTSSTPLRECSAKASGPAQLLKVELPEFFVGSAGKWTIYEVQLRAV